jgi:predicted PurR-regulated permease PerM
MINFMMNQIANLEQQLHQSTNTVRNNVDIDRDNLIKLKSEVRNTSEYSQSTISGMNNRMTELE